MKFAVIQFPGSNCDIDLYEALHTVCGADVAYVPSKESSLDGFDAVMLPGGFSYGDYLRAGAIARFTNIMPAIVEMAKAGKPFLVEAPMENIVVPTPGCWNINDIYTPKAGIKNGKLRPDENGEFHAPDHGHTHKA